MKNNVIKLFGVAAVICCLLCGCRGNGKVESENTNPTPEIVNGVVNATADITTTPEATATPEIIVTPEVIATMPVTQAPVTPAPVTATPVVETANPVPVTPTPVPVTPTPVTPTPEPEPTKSPYMTELG